MPKELEECVKKVQKKRGRNAAWAICIKELRYTKKKGGGWVKKRK